MKTSARKGGRQSNGRGKNPFPGFLVTRNVLIARRRTSLRMEADIWDALDEVCLREGLTLNELCVLIERRRKNRASRTSAVRSFIVSYFRNAANGRHLGRPPAPGDEKRKRPWKDMSALVLGRRAGAFAAAFHDPV
jgi:predicted DNA-binding ribbon-helix-helix protein